MDILNTSNVNGVRPGTPVERKSSVSSVEKKPKPAHDEVILSGQSQSLPEADKEKELVLERLKVLPEVRPNLLNQAKEKLQNGGYSGSEFFSKLSDKLISG